MTYNFKIFTFLFILLFSSCYYPAYWDSPRPFDKIDVIIIMNDFPGFYGDMVHKEVIEKDNEDFMKYVEKTQKERYPAYSDIRYVYIQRNYYEDYEKGTKWIFMAILNKPTLNIKRNLP